MYGYTEVPEETERERLLLHEMVKHAEFIAPDEFAEGYSIYHVDLGAIGFSISARIANLGATVEIRDWSTYNA